MSHAARELETTLSPTRTILQRVCEGSVIGMIIAIPTSHALCTLFSITFLVSLLAQTGIAPVIERVRTSLPLQLALGLCLFAMLSLTYTTAPFVGGVTELRKFFRIMMIPFLVVAFQDHRLREKAVTTFLLTISGILVLAMLKWLGVIVYKDLDPNHLFLSHIPTSYFISFAAFIAAHRYLRRDHYAKYYALFIVAASLNTFFLNTARTGHFVALILIPLFCWQVWRSKGLIVGLCALPLLLLTLMTVSPTFHSTAVKANVYAYNQYQRGNYATSNGFRVVFIKTALMLIAKNPVLGTGIASHRVEYAKYDLPPLRKGLGWGNPHNQFLFTAVELGLVGLGILLAWFISLGVLSLSLPSYEGALLQGLIVSFSAASCCDSFLFLAASGVFFCLFVALFSGAAHKVR